MRALIAAAAIVLAVPALGQATDFQTLLNGKDTPATMQVKDLTPEWRRIAISAPGATAGAANDTLKQLMQLGMAEGGKGGDAMGMVFALSMFGGLGKTDGPVTYYTRGSMVTVGTETFLVAYRYEAPGLNLMQLIADSQKNGGKEPDFAKLMDQGKMKPDSLLNLAFVNVRSIGAVSGVRAFDLEREIAESGSEGILPWLAMLGSSRTMEAPTAVPESAPMAAERATPAKKTGAKPPAKPPAK